MAARPTIKGIFVNSHIKAVERECGPQGLRELEDRFGSRLKFHNSEDVPVADEVRLIEHALDVMRRDEVPADQRAFEAGRLHFVNFSQTPYGRIIFSVFRRNFKMMMMTGRNIAGHVFKGVVFSAEDLGDKAVRMTISNNDYPIEHFQGLFQQWMDFSGNHGTVEARALDDGEYQYEMTWR